jgi:hypothetical protein
MNGYVARKGNRWYAVIYEGLDPVTGREIRRWHPAGTDKASAEKLARRLARELNGPDDRGRGLTFGAFLTETWLPSCARRPGTATSASCTATSSPRSDPLESDASDRRSSRISTSPSCAPPTTHGRSRQRRCWRSTS